MLAAFRKLFAHPNRHSRRAGRAGTAAKSTPKLGAMFAPLEDRLTPVVGAYDIPAEVPIGGAYDAVGQYGGAPDQNWDTAGGGTGTLLNSYRHVISAKHVVGDTGPGGPNTRFRLLGPDNQEVVIHSPSARKDAAPDGEDMTVLTLKELAPLTLKPFEIYAGSDELGKLVTHVGYGRTGTGTTGRLLRANGVGAEEPSKLDVEEAQRIRIVGTPTGGTFSVWVPTSPNSKITLASWVSAAQVENALQLLPGVQDVRVTKVAAAPGHPYAGSFEVVFATVNTAMYPDYNVPTLAVQSNLVGGSAFAETIIDGGTPNKKRIGFNHVGRVTDTSIRSDFDNGGATANVFDDGLGLGAAEAAGASGDSGSSVFIDGKIAGIFTHMQLDGLNGVSADQDFGSSSRSVRVSAYQDFIGDLLDADYDLVLNMNNQPWGNDRMADDIRFNTDRGQLRIFIDGVLRYQDALSSVKSVTLIGSGDDETISMEKMGAIPVTVNAGEGNDTVRVVGVSAGANFRADGQGGNDLIAVGAGLLDLRTHINGDLSLYGGGGNDRVEFRDQNANDSGVEYLLSGPLFTRSGMLEPVYYAGFDSLGLTTGKQSATVNIESAAAPLVQITGGAASDQFNFGTGTIGVGSTDFVLNGGGGADDLRLSDAQSNVARTHRFEGNQYTVDGQSGTVTYSSFDDVLLFAGKKGDTVEVASSPDGVHLTLAGNGGNDAFVLGTGDLDQIRETITIYGGTGYDSVTLSDQNEAQWKSFEILTLGVYRTGFGLTVLSVDSMTLNTGSATNNFYVHGTPGLTTINAGGGADSFFLSPDDRDLNRLNRGLILNGQGGGDVVFFNDQNSTGNSPYTLTGSTLTRGGFPGVQFDGMELVRLILSEEANTVNIQGTKAATQVRIDGNGGNDTFRITDEPNSKVSIFGGAGNDKVIWGPSLLPPNHPNSGFGFLDLHGVEQIVFPLVG